MSLVGLTQEEFDQTMMSVGSHKKQRPLSPIEVASNMHQAERAGASKSDIATSLGFSGSTMVSRFFNLLELSEEVQFLVEWQETADDSIGFSVAVELAKMPRATHKQMVRAIVENGLTKKETVSIRQLLERSCRSLSDCIDDVVGRRARTHIRHIVIGKLTDLHVSQVLRRMRQSERDQLFKVIINDLYPRLRDFSIKLGVKEFAVIGGKSVGDTIASNSEFEVDISNHLVRKIAGNV